MPTIYNAEALKLLKANAKKHDDVKLFKHDIHPRIHHLDDITTKIYEELDALHALEGGGGGFFVEGGYNNESLYDNKGGHTMATGATRFSIIASGSNNTMQGTLSAIMGGDSNAINIFYGNTPTNSVIVGGQSNTVNGASFAGIVAGHTNTINTNSPASYEFIGGGEDNTISVSSWGTIVGGWSNYLNAAQYSAMIGGYDNLLESGDYAAIIGSESGSIGGSSNHSVIIGGNNPTISGFQRSVTLGGLNLTADDDDKVFLDKLYGAGKAGFGVSPLNANAQLTVLGLGNNDAPAIFGYDTNVSYGTGVYGAAGDAVDYTNLDSVTQGLVGVLGYVNSDGAAEGIASAGLFESNVESNNIVAVYGTKVNSTYQGTSTTADLYGEAVETSLSGASAQADLVYGNLTTVRFSQGPTANIVYGHSINLVGSFGNPTITTAYGLNVDVSDAEIVAGTTDLYGIRQVEASAINQFDGKLGIGLSPVNEKLELSTGLLLGAAAGTVNGTVQYTGSDVQARIGGAWVSLTGGGGMVTGISKNSGATVNAANRSVLNFIEGSNITLTISDDAAGDEVDITIAASGGGGTGLTPTLQAGISSTASNGDLVIVNAATHAITLPTPTSGDLVGVYVLTGTITDIEVRGHNSTATINGVDRSSIGYPLYSQYDYYEFFAYNDGANVVWGIR